MTESPTIELVFITYNRLDYTKLALRSILADPSEKFSLVIWDNASTDGTAEFLRDSVSDHRIREIHLSNKNVGQTAAVNQVWASSKADLLGKLDNDCLVTPGWTRSLAKAHRDIPELGVVACWHYFPDDFDYLRAKHKIQRFGQHQILRHPWTCGTGILIKRQTFEKYGSITKNATTSYWLQMALDGMVNGFYYPLIHQEHMDDPKSKYTHLTDEQSYQAAKSVTYNINNHGQNTLADRWQWRQKVLDDLLEGPWQANRYVGWRASMRRLKAKGKRLLMTAAKTSKITQPQTENSAKRLITRTSNTYRLPQFRTTTEIVESNSNTTVCKYPMTQQARDFIMSLPQKEAGNVTYAKGIFTICQGTLQKDHISYPYTNAPSMVSILTTLLTNSQAQKADNLLREFFNKIKALPHSTGTADDFFAAFLQQKNRVPLECLDRGLIDLTTRNIHIDGENWIVLDNEWSFDFPVPTIFILFRSLLELSIKLQPLIRKNASLINPVSSFIASRRSRYYAPLSWLEHIQHPDITFDDLLTWELAFEKYVTADISANVRRIDHDKIIRASFTALEIHNPLKNLKRKLLSSPRIAHATATT